MFELGTALVQLIIKRENIMKMKKLLVLAIDVALIIIIAALFLLTNQVIILAIMAFVVFVVIRPYIFNRRKYLNGI